MKLRDVAVGLLAGGMAMLASAPVQAESDPTLGQIALVAGSYCPLHWTNADGQLLPIAQNQTLYSLFGTTYGGDGRVTFGIPDLRGRALVSAGQSPSGIELTLGEKVGGETVTLSTSNLPPHRHSLNASPIAATEPNPAGNDLGEFVGGAIPGYSNQEPEAAVVMAANTIAPAGGGQSFNVRQPALVMRYCVALQGAYPTRP